MAGEFGTGKKKKTVEKTERPFNYSFWIKIAIALFMIIAIALSVYSHFESDAEQKDEIMNPETEVVAIVELAETNNLNTESTTIQGGEIKIYNQEFYMTDISLTGTVAEFYIENRGNSPGSNWFRMQILYSFKAPSGELIETGTYIPINQERVDIMPGTKTKFTVDIKNAPGSSVGNVDVKDFKIIQIEGL